MIFPNSIRKIKCLLVILAALVIGDGLITQFLVGNGLGYEANPLLAGLVGGWSFVIIKTAGAFLSAIILWDIYRRWSRLGAIAIPCFVVMYAGIVAWNISTLFVHLTWGS
ncbi:MAG: DUF5658 family protein [Chloroflexota bacterium]